jgi:acyl-CoA thioester hydrolase
MSQSPSADQSVVPVDSIEIQVRVRYAECDPMGVAHHSVYPIWMEIARTDMLRRGGLTYREMEARGIGFVVARMSLRYRKPARYDDELRIRCASLPCAGVKIDHEYEIFRGSELLTSAQTTLVCVDLKTGRPQPIPAGIFGR